MAARSNVESIRDRPSLRPLALLLLMLGAAWLAALGMIVAQLT